MGMFSTRGGDENMLYSTTGHYKSGKFIPYGAIVLGWCRYGTGAMVEGFRRRVGVGMVLRAVVPFLEVERSYRPTWEVLPLLKL